MDTEPSQLGPGTRPNNWAAPSFSSGPSAANAQRKSPAPTKKTGHWQK